MLIEYKEFLEWIAEVHRNNPSLSSALKKNLTNLASLIEMPEAAKVMFPKLIENLRPLVGKIIYSEEQKKTMEAGMLIEAFEKDRTQTYFINSRLQQKINSVKSVIEHLSAADLAEIKIRLDKLKNHFDHLSKNEVILSNDEKNLMIKELGFPDKVKKIIPDIQFLFELVKKEENLVGELSKIISFSKSGAENFFVLKEMISGSGNVEDSLYAFSMFAFAFGEENDRAQAKNNLVFQKLKGELFSSKISEIEQEIDQSTQIQSQLNRLMKTKDRHNLKEFFLNKPGQKTSEGLIHIALEGIKNYKKRQEDLDRTDFYLGQLSDGNSTFRKELMLFVLLRSDDGKALQDEVVLEINKNLGFNPPLSRNQILSSLAEQLKEHCLLAAEGDQDKAQDYFNRIDSAMVKVAMRVNADGHLSVNVAKEIATLDQLIKPKRDITKELTNAIKKLLVFIKDLPIKDLAETKIRLSIINDQSTEYSLKNQEMRALFWENGFSKKAHEIAIVIKVVMDELHEYLIQATKNKNVKYQGWNAEMIGEALDKLMPQNESLLDPEIVAKLISICQGVSDFQKDNIERPDEVVDIGTKMILFAESVSNKRSEMLNKDDSSKDAEAVKKITDQVPSHILTVSQDVIEKKIREESPELFSREDLLQAKYFALENAFDEYQNYLKNKILNYFKVKNLYLAEPVYDVDEQGKLKVDLEENPDININNLNPEDPAIDQEIRDDIKKYVVINKARNKLNGEDFLSYRLYDCKDIITHNIPILKKNVNDFETRFLEMISKVFNYLGLKGGPVSRKLEERKFAENISTLFSSSKTQPVQAEPEGHASKKRTK